MVSVSEATSIINSHLFAAASEEVTTTNLLGRILAEPVLADRDFPPFNRVAMDGIAIQFTQLEHQKDFKIESIAAAGTPQKTLGDKTKCIEVMTGAPLPKNTDTVIRYEDLNLIDGKATILIHEVILNQNVHAQGQDARKNDLLLPIGTPISPAEVALIASVGKSSAKVKSNPRAAIISTGDELVDITENPEPHQIRRSNSYALQSALKSAGCESVLFHIPDRKDLIEAELKLILDKHDLVILSGGVSKGKFDFVPEAFEKLGVKKHFHRVKQKPGKPFWFGSKENKTVFALPGNPVSTYMCFYKYIKPWLFKSLGQPSKNDHAVLGDNFQFKGDLTYFLQVRVLNKNGTLVAHPLPGGGSGDFANLKDVNAFMELPEGIHSFGKGEVFPIYYSR